MGIHGIYHYHIIYSFEAGEPKYGGIVVNILYTSPLSEDITAANR